MTNGELFIRENPDVEIKINGSCVWIYFEEVNHYTMPVKWWDKEIDVLNKIRAEIEEHAKINQNLNIDRARALCWCLDVIDKYRAESEE